MTAEEVLNANFAEKLRARAENRVPMVITPAEPSNAASPEAVELRFKAKMAARHEAAKAAAEPAKVEAASAAPATPAAPVATPPVVEASKPNEAADLAALEEATRPDESKSKPKFNR